MFSDKEIQAYKKISAPPELYYNVKSSAFEKSRVRMTVIIKTLGAVAACLVIAVAVMIFSSNKSPDIICNGQSLNSSILFYDVSQVSDIRESTALVVPFTFELHEDVEIILSKGRLIDADGAAIEGTFKKGEIEVFWEIPRSDKHMDCEMILKGEKTTTVIELTYDKTEKTITVIKK